MRDRLRLGEKLQTLVKVAELGGEDHIMAQTVAKLLDYATDRHQRDLEDIEVKLRTLETQFGMPSAQFADQFQRGVLGDDEVFLRWDALLTMRERIAQRLAMLQAAVSP
jgi:translation initiation factor 2 alpha subunit (eIF-2alpha)